MWYRAVAIQYASIPLSTIHTKQIATRFSPGYLAAVADQFEILYLAEDFQIALYEHGAMLGSPFTPGRQTPNPRFTPVIFNVSVNLQQIVDLSDYLAVQIHMRTTVQELTGDWAGYQSRKAGLTSVKGPIGWAPTQKIGAELHRLGFEGFRTVSAKASTHRNLVVFPGNMRRGSRVEFQNPNPGLPSHIIAP